MMSVADILREKGQSVIAIDAEGSVLEALALMAEHDIGGVVVVEEGKVLGIYSERELARQAARDGACRGEGAVRDVMSTEVEVVSPDTTVEECMEVIDARHVRLLPVVQDAEVVGIVTIGDVVHALLEERLFLIRQLEDYIRGRHR